MLLEGLPARGRGLALDLYHMNIEERDIPASILRAAGRIAHVQVSASDRGRPAPTTPETLLERPRVDGQG
jgi:D-psicose/D-tagatose/L-ribulose 3-epimerase